MLRHPEYTRTRLQQLGERMKLKIYSQQQPVDELLVSPPVDRISVADAQKLEFRAATIGEQFGPQWASFWFKATAVVPENWQGRVDVLWDSHSEATLWMNARSIQGLNSGGAGDRPDATLLSKARGGETLEFQIEMACNRKFGTPAMGAVKSVSPYVLDKCDIALFDATAWELFYDFSILQQLEAESAKPNPDLDPTWAGLLLSELNRFANVYDENSRETWDAAHAILKSLYQHRNADSVHELSAIGHAHIDTAWLWPLAETWRKCERTFSTATAYMDDYPDYKFSCSQAVQYEVIKTRNPDLYERIQEKVRRGQWVPVGGTWIEPDCNIPSGEALARQFLFGQRFFEKEFGKRCLEFWNPDVFGYNGQLPQLMKLSGISRFLTQKLSWNRFNKPHHHTFVWQGIDGSEVLAHFPPADTYNAEASSSQIRENARNYKDHDRSRHSLMLFGFGDGGGGPTKTMLETLRRAENLQGLPRTKIRSSDEFFELLENDIEDRPLQIGELYFEYHRGTYTSQAATKKGNRQGEQMLHDVEFLASLAHKLHGAPYPTDELSRLWKLLLLNQFHDILPGSSITLVYEDAARDYAEIQSAGKKLRDAALQQSQNDQTQIAPFNTTNFARREVCETPDKKLVFIEAPSYGIGKIADAPESVKIDGLVLENEFLRAEFSSGGDLISLIEKSSGRETMSAPGNRFEIYDDQPTNYDAWDVDPFHLETGKVCAPATEFKNVRNEALRGEISFSRKISETSTLKQIVRLDADSRRLEFHTQVEWNEAHKMLKVAFPVNVRAMNATYEMQFGHVERPTHFNTFYDLARYEVPGHKWADLSEHGFGVALLSESKYGFSTFGDTMRMSLLRAPKHPDPTCDIGHHEFVYALMPHQNGWREAGVVAAAANFNAPILWTQSNGATTSFFSVDDPNLVLDTIKKAEDSNALILRFYECHGARGTAKIKIDLPFSSANFCNILEDDGEKVRIENGEIEVSYSPFQIISLKLV